MDGQLSDLRDFVRSERLHAVDAKSDTPLPPDQAADEAFQKLGGLIRKFENSETPYLSVVLPMWENRYGNYDDLARIKEWSAGGTGEDEE